MWVAGWTLAGLLSASQSAATYAATGYDLRIGLILKVTMPWWYAWMVLGVIAVWAAHRLPLEADRWLPRLPVHLLLNTLLAAAVVIAHAGARHLLGVPPSRGLRLEFLSSANANALAYWTIVLLVHAAAYYRGLRERQLRESELAAQLAEARLQALRMQLHPHFLFNTLHAIAAFVRRQPARAEDMLGELAELLRVTLESSSSHEVPLREEIDFIRRYTGIQQARFDDRLSVGIEVDSAAENVLVPTLVLQPLVENAIEHGVGQRRGGGKIRIVASLRDGRLLLRVADDGPGLAADAAPESWRTGLRNTAARLAELYGDDQRFELRRLEGGGLEAVLDLPLRVADADEAPECDDLADGDGVGEG